MATCHEVGAQFDIVEDLAIEAEDEIAVATEHRLLTVFETYDRQPAVAEANISLGVDTDRIWTTMREGIGHATQQLAGVERVHIGPEISRYPAHGLGLILVKPS
jgi:hypothetical protein